MLRAFAWLFQGKASTPRLSLERKLEILASCGLRLAPPFTVEDLLQSWSRDLFEKEGFDTVLAGLGMTEERPPWRNHCVNAWHLDMECIEGDGSYSRIADRMKEMAQGSLPIENIRDHVDVEERVAWLAFDYQGRKIRIDCKINDDWVDTDVFRTLVELLAKSDPSKIFLYYDLHGQDCIIACVSAAQFGRLKQQGIGFRPLR